MSEVCVACEEPVVPGEDRRANRDGSMLMHRECALRSGIGGIGHLIDHAHFCRGVGPDAGLPLRLSALLVDAWVSYYGVEATVKASHAAD